MLMKVAGFGKWLTLLAMLFLYGCAAPAVKLNPSESMLAGEGALVLVSHCPFKEGIVFEIHRISGPGPSVSRTHVFSSGVEFAAFKFPAGRYSLRRILIGSYNLYLRGDGADFDILPGRVAYFGDFYISSNGAGSDSLTVNIRDQQDAIENLLSTRYPDLLEKYPLEVVEVN